MVYSSNLALFGMLSSYFSYWQGPRSDLLEFLTPSSKELDDLHLSFLRVCENIYVANFFETIPMNLFGLPLFLISVFHMAPTLPKYTPTRDGREGSLL